MSDPKKEKPRLIRILTIFLILQAPVVALLGLNLVTDHWSFLFSWSVFWEDIQEAFSLVITTPGELNVDEILFYSVVAFTVLLVSAGTALFAGLSFNNGQAFTWVMSLVAQIGTLVAGIGLYIIYQPSQATWLIAIGVLMVLYLNYGEVRQWFLQAEVVQHEEVHD